MSNPNQVVVSQVSDVTTVEITTRGAQGPAFSDGDKGDVTVLNDGTTISINNNAITSAKILDGTIVDADINASAAIALSKLATGALPTAITVTSANISDLSIVDADISSSAAISLSKLATGALPTGITISSANIPDLTIVNSDVSASAAIAGTKINPDFGSQNVVTTGTFGSGDITILDASPALRFTENDANPDYKLIVNNGVFKIVDETNSNADRLVVNTDGHVDVTGNLDVGAGLDVTGDITVTGTVDNVDIATRDTLFGGLTSSSGVLTDGVTATTQSASDNSTKVATTAYTDTAVANLVDSAPGTLNTLNELAAALGDDPNFATTVTNSIATKLPLAGGQMTGNITFSGTQTVDGRDLSVDGAKLDTIESNATADQTASDIKTLFNSSGLVNAQIDASAAIAGTKISPDFGSQNITTLGNIICGDGSIGSLVIKGNQAFLKFTDNNDNDDFEIRVDGGKMMIQDQQNDLVSLQINTDGHVDIPVNLDVGAGVDVTGNVIASGYFQTTGNEIKIEGISPFVRFTETNDNPDYLIQANQGALVFKDSTNAAERIKINSDGHVQIPADDAKLQIGASQDLALYHDSNHSYIEDSGTGELRLKSNLIRFQGANGESLGVFEQDSATALYFNNSIKLNTNAVGIRFIGNIRGIDNEKIQLGASQDMQLFHDGTNSFFTNATGSLLIRSNNLDLRPQTNANEVYLRCTQNGSVELRFDTVKKFETHSTGGNVTGSLGINTNTPASTIDARADSGATITARNTGTAASISMSVGSSTNQLVSRGVNSSTARDLLFMLGTTTAAKIDTSNNFLIPTDNAKLQIGASQDLQLFHTGVFSNINNATGDLDISSDVTRLKNGNRTENFAAFLNNGQAEFYFDNSKKFLTTSSGVKITGNLELASTYPSLTWTDTNHDSDYRITNNDGQLIIYDITNSAHRLNVNADGNIQIPTDNARLQIGAGQDLQIYHDASNSILQNATGALLLQSNDLKLGNYNLSDVYFRGQADNAAELYFDNSKKLETTANGVLMGSSYTASGSASNLIINNSSGNAGITIAAANASRSSIYFGDSDSASISFMEYNHSADRFRHYVNNLLAVQITNDIEITLGRTTFGQPSSVKVYGNAGSARKDALLVLNATASVAQRGAGVAVGGNTEKIACFYARKSTANDSDGGNGFIESVGNLTLHVNDSETGIDVNANGSVELYYDNSKKLQTHSWGVEIIGALSATNIAATSSTSTFGTIQIPSDNTKLQIGASQDLQLYHDGSNSAIQNATGTLYLYGGSDNIRIRPENGDDSIVAKPNNSVELYFDNSKKFETTSTGVSVTGRLSTTDRIQVQNAGQAQLRVGSTDASGAFLYFDGDSDGNFSGSDYSYIGMDDQGRLRLLSDNPAQSGDILFSVANGSGNSETAARMYGGGAVNLYFDHSKKFETTSTGVEISGHADITGELNLIGSGAKYLDVDTLSNSNTFHIRHRSNTGSNFHNAARFIANGAVELYHSNSKKFETTSAGVSITGRLNLSDNLDMPDNAKIILGDGDDIKIFHDGSSSRFQDSYGHLNIGSNIVELKTGDLSEIYLTAIANGAVSIRHDNSIKFSTTSVGATVTDVFSITDSSGGQRLLMGNQDSAGVDCPKIFAVGNASLTIGIGDSWSGDGGTLTNQFNIAKNGTITSYGNHDFGAGIDVTGAITGTADATINGITIGKGANSVAGNTVLGENALDANTTGGSLVAVGKDALTNNTSGSENIAVGHQALRDNSDGTFNIAIGHNAVRKMTSSKNIGIGFEAIQGATGTLTGTNNIGIGYEALHDITSGNSNIGIGNNTLDDNHSGTGNIAIGVNSLSLTESDNNTAVGHGAGVNLVSGSNNTFIGRRAGNYASPGYTTTQSNRIVLGDNDITNAFIKVAFTVTSDQRDKIEDGVVSHGLDFVNQLKPKSFFFKKERDSNEKHGDKRYGFFAQDILALEGSDNVIIDNSNIDSLGYKADQLIPILVKAIQELTIEVNKLKSNG